MSQISCHFLGHPLLSISSNGSEGERAFERKKMYFLHYMKKFINIRFYVPTLVPRESDSTVDQSVLR